MGRSNDIRAAVIDDLTFDPDVDASDIRVEEMDGDVVLTGSVPSYPQYVQAAAVAARAAGVRCVHSHLQVALPRGDHRDDLTLAAMASDALTLGGTVPEGVEATAKDGRHHSHRIRAYQHRAGSGGSDGRGAHRCPARQERHPGP
jgi:hypothetical protein